MLEDYVSFLKDTVGIPLLIKAVGIGEGKQDLTGIAVEPIKTHRVFSPHPEIPIGKACSLLTSEEIIKFLTGNFRLSKSRTGDLFWEAVWPRLLAKGWHSEQPNYGQGSSGSKHSLVFLLPGIKKFSRKKLVKGNHYFDSVSDILNKVVSDPGLLELETEAYKGSEQKAEYRWDGQMEEDTDDLSNQQRHCYLQPPTSNNYQDPMKFTIVDTSSVYGEEQAKLIALKSLPIDTTDIFTHPCLLNETEENTLEEYEEEIKVNSASVPAENLSDRGASANSLDHASSILNSGVPNELCLKIGAVESHKVQKTSVFNEKLKKTADYKLGQKVKCVHSSLLAPVPKRPRLFVCGNGESSCKIENLPADSKPKEEKCHHQSNSPDACEKMVVQVVQTQNLLSPNSSAKGSPDKSNEGTPTESCPRVQLSLEKPEPHPLIDLNVLPSIPPELEFYEPLAMQTVASLGNLGGNESSALPETNQHSKPPKPLDGEDSKEQQSAMNGRRHSTRNRPLSTKALEALASGYFFNTKRKRMGVPKSSRQVRGRTAASGTLNNDAGNGIAVSRIEKGGWNGASCNNAKLVDESQE